MGNCEFRKKWRSEGRCIYCGKPRDGAEATKILCGKCSRTRKEQYHRRRAKYLSMGLCVECGDIREGPSATDKLCGPCDIKRRIKNDKQKKKVETEPPGIPTFVPKTQENKFRVSESRSLWNKQGWCVGCGHPHRKTGTLFCRPCFDHVQERKKAS